MKIFNLHPLKLRNQTLITELVCHGFFIKLFTYKI